MTLCFLGDAITHHMRRWTKFFALRGHDVHVITFNPKTLPNYEPVKLHVIPKLVPGRSLFSRILNLLPLVFRVKKILKSTAADLLHCHDAGGYSWTAMFSGFHPVIVSAQGNDILINPNKSRLTRVLTRLGLRSADLVHCDGYGMKDEIVKLGVDEQKIRIVFFGTDVTKFRPPVDKEAMRQECGLRGNVVISSRRLDPVHNVETLIDAIPGVLTAVPDAVFLIAGYGSEEEILMDKVRLSHLEHAVRFLGMIEEHQMIRYLQMADVYVATSLSESGIAASTAEAMACALPIINTDTGDIRMWINDGENGFIIPPKKPAILAGRIVRLLQDPDTRAIFGDLNRKLIIERNNYHVEMGKIERIYQQIVEAGDVH